MNLVLYILAHARLPAGGLAGMVDSVESNITSPGVVAQHEFVRRFVDLALPHQVLAYVRQQLAANKEPEIEDANTRLDHLHRRLTQEGERIDGAVDDELLSFCLRSVEPRLGKTIADILTDDRQRNDRLHQRYSHILDRTVAETRLVDYVERSTATNDEPDQAKTAPQEITLAQIGQWARSVDDAVLAGRALDSSDTRASREASNALGGRYQKRVRGCCELWCDRSEEVDDIGQEAWARAFAKLSRYDPALGSFGSFVTMHVRYAILDKYRRRKHDGPNADDGEHSGPELQAPSTDLFLDDRCVNALLGIIFNPEKSPHQALAYGYCKLLQYKPAEVVAEKSEVVLKLLEPQFSAEFEDVFAVGEDATSGVMVPFRATLEKTLAELTTHGKTRAAYAAVLNTVLGLTAFRDYYRSDTAVDNANDVVKWWSAVHVRLLAAAAKSPHLKDCL